MANHPNTGFLQRLYHGLIEARERQVRPHVNAALLMLDDDTLRAHGYKREDLVRNGAKHAGL